MNILKEGGHAFPEVNSTVPKPLLDVNISNALKLAGFGGLRYEVVGNKLKDFFGDIDIAVDVKDLAKFLKIKSTDKDTFFEELKKYLDTVSTPTRIVKGLSQIHLLVPLIDKSGKQISAFDAEGKQIKGKPGLIQIDVFIGNLEWMTGINSGAPADSKFKASYRNVLLYCIFNSLVFPTGKENEFERYVMNFRDGFRKDTVIKQVTKTGKEKFEKISSKPISASPDKLANFLFGSSVRWEDMQSFEKLKALFNSPKFKYPQFRKEIAEMFSKEVSKLPQGVPNLLEQMSVFSARPQRWKVYFDLDETLSDYRGQLKKTGLKPTDTIGSIEFWETAEMLPGAKELFEYASRHYKVEVLTASPKSDEAHEGKKRWVANNLGTGIPVHITRSGKEKAAFASANSILIDDKKENVVAFQKAGGVGILATNPQHALMELKSMKKKLTNEGLEKIIRSVLQEQLEERSSTRATQKYCFSVLEDMKECLRKGDWEQCKKLCQVLAERLEMV